MGILDFLFDKEKKQQRQIKSLRKKLHNMWVQSPERNYSAEQLRDIGTEEAYEALLERFKLNAQNTTYDNEEKLFIYEMLVNVGDDVIDPIKAYIHKEEQQVNWPMKILNDLMGDDEMADFIEELLSKMTIDYQRDPEKKQQLILRAKSFEDHEGLKKQIARFVMDDNEGIRFVAIDQIIDLDTDWALSALQGNLRFEDSGRILGQVCAKFASRDDWSALEDPEDEEARLDLEERLPREYLLSEDGTLRVK